MVTVHTSPEFALPAFWTCGAVVSKPSMDQLLHPPGPESSRPSGITPPGPVSTSTLTMPPCFPNQAPTDENNPANDNAPGTTDRGRYGILERETGLEPATLSLGSSRTNRATACAA